MLHVGYSVLSFFAKGEEADMASGGTALLAGTGIKPKANTAMALWGIMSPEGPCCFQERFALFFRAHDEDEDCLEDGYDT